jgi:hypothetical protein
MKQKENGGDQCAGVTDADPPNEVGDGKSPRHWDVHAPNADAFEEQPGDGEVEH